MTQQSLRMTGAEVQLRRNGAEGAPPERRVSLPAFFSGLEDTIEVALPLLPPGTRWARVIPPSDGARWATIFLFIEELPRVRTVSWERRPVTIALPYCVYSIAVIRNLERASLPSYTWHATAFLHFRNEPLRSLTDPLFLPILPHTYAGKMCAESQYARVPLTETVQGCLDRFWSTNFRENGDRWNLEWVAAPSLDARFESIHAWAAATKEDPSFVLRVPWRPSGRTPATILDKATAVPPRPTTVGELVDLVMQCPDMRSSLST